MPEMGIPKSQTQRRLSQVTMTRKPSVQRSEDSEVNKEELLNRLAGRPPETKVKNIRNPNELGKNEFLKLLAHQLQNQDPFKPKDQNKFAAELAQFSQLEQLANLNTKFESIDEGKNLERRFYAASMVGKKVVLQGSSIEVHKPGEKVDMLFSLEKPAQKMVIRILDPKGNIVQEQWMENVGRGNHSVPWNGMSLDKSYAAAGEYQLSMMAWDEQDKQFMVATNATGTVQSVSLEGDEPVLNVDGKQVYLRDVKSFHIAHDVKKGDNERKEWPTMQGNKPAATQQAKQGVGRGVDAYQKLQSIYD
jgi:flagellar basal-body rod modification protein FlgD